MLNKRTSVKNKTHGTSAYDLTGKRGLQFSKTAHCAKETVQIVYALVGVKVKRLDKFDVLVTELANARLCLLKSVGRLANCAVKCKYPVDLGESNAATESCAKLSRDALF